MISEKLKNLIVKMSGVYPNEVVATASLENDLGITGDDAIELLLAFSKEFNVNISCFMAADYFEGEGYSLFFKKLNGKPKKVLNVGHLEKAIVAGRLDEEVINS